eukprot:scaffold12.g8287.t1
MKASLVKQAQEAVQHAGRGTAAGDVQQQRQRRVAARRRGAGADSTGDAGPSQEQQRVELEGTKGGSSARFLRPEAHGRLQELLAGTLSLADELAPALDTLCSSGATLPDSQLCLDVEGEAAPQPLYAVIRILLGEDEEDGAEALAPAYAGPWLPPSQQEQLRHPRSGKSTPAHVEASSRGTAETLRLLREHTTALAEQGVLGPLCASAPDAGGGWPAESCNEGGQQQPHRLVQSDWACQLLSLLPGYLQSRQEQPCSGAAAQWAWQQSEQFTGGGAHRQQSSQHPGRNDLSTGAGSREEAGQALTAAAGGQGAAPAAPQEWRWDGAVVAFEDDAIEWDDERADEGGQRGQSVGQHGHAQPHVSGEEAWASGDTDTDPWLRLEQPVPLPQQQEGQGRQVGRQGALEPLQGQHRVPVFKPRSKPQALSQPTPSQARPVEGEGWAAGARGETDDWDDALMEEVAVLEAGVLQRQHQAAPHAPAGAGAAPASASDAIEDADSEGEGEQRSAQAAGAAAEAGGQRSVPRFAARRPPAAPALAAQGEEAVAMADGEEEARSPDAHGRARGPGKRLRGAQQRRAQGEDEGGDGSSPPVQVDWGLVAALRPSALLRQPPGSKPKWRPVHDPESLLLQPPRPALEEAAATAVAAAAAEGAAAAAAAASGAAEAAAAAGPAPAAQSAFGGGPAAEQLVAGLTAADLEAWDDWSDEEESAQAPAAAAAATSASPAPSSLCKCVWPEAAAVGAGGWQPAPQHGRRLTQLVPHQQPLVCFDDEPEGREQGPAAAAAATESGTLHQHQWQWGWPGRAADQPQAPATQPGPMPAAQPAPPASGQRLPAQQREGAWAWPQRGGAARGAPGSTQACAFSLTPQGSGFGACEVVMDDEDEELQPHVGQQEHAASSAPGLAAGAPALQPPATQVHALPEEPETAARGQQLLQLWQHQLGLGSEYGDGVAPVWEAAARAGAGDGAGQADDPWAALEAEDAEEVENGNPQLGGRRSEPKQPGGSGAQWGQLPATSSGAGGALPGGAAAALASPAWASAPEVVWEEDGVDSAVASQQAGGAAAGGGGWGAPAAWSAGEWAWAPGCEIVLNLGEEQEGWVGSEDHLERCASAPALAAAEEAAEAGGLLCEVVWDDEEEGEPEQARLGQGQGQGGQKQRGGRIAQAGSAQAAAAAAGKRRHEDLGAEIVRALLEERQRSPVDLAPLQQQVSAHLAAALAAEAPGSAGGTTLSEVQRALAGGGLAACQASRQRYLLALLNAAHQHNSRAGAMSEGSGLAVGRSGGAWARLILSSTSGGRDVRIASVARAGA